MGGERAEYGEQIVSALSAQLTAEFGRGFGRTNLFYMVQFAETFQDLEIVQTLSGQLSWSHFLAIIPLDTFLKRDFYAEMCRIERWSVRTLRQKIDRMLFERTAIAKKPEELIRADLDALRDEDRLTPDLVFRNPYFLDFLGLTGSLDERRIREATLTYCGPQHDRLRFRENALHQATEHPAVRRRVEDCRLQHQQAHEQS